MNATELSKPSSFSVSLLFVTVALDTIFKILIQTKADENERGKGVYFNFFLFLLSSFLCTSLYVVVLIISQNCWGKCLNQCNSLVQTQVC